MSKKLFKSFDFIVLDLISLIFSFFVVYRYTDVHKFFEFNEMYRTLFIVEILVYLILIFILNPYKDFLKNDSIKNTKKIFGFSISEFIVSFFIIYTIRGQIFVSRIFYASHFVLYFLVSSVLRSSRRSRLIARAGNSYKKGNKNLLIVTKNDNVGDIVRMVENNNYDYFRVVGLCLIDKDRKGQKVGELDVVIDFNELIDYVCHNWVDDVYFDLPSGQIPRDILRQLSETGITTHIRLCDMEYFVGQQQYTEEILSYPVLTSTVKEKNVIETITKRFADVVGGIVGCFVTFLLVIFVGPIIYLKSPGNIFYVSTRIGKNGKPFKFYKFRTMSLDADSKKEELSKLNKIESNLMFKIDNDPRVIPGIGEFLRKTSLDEFPQFFNVLKGDMSLVGTRPPTTDEWEKYDTNHRMRMSIKPGITGLWQTSGRSNVCDFEEVVRMDIYYIYRWSLKLDFKILLKTCKSVLKKDGAQ